MNIKKLITVPNIIALTGALFTWFGIKNLYYKAGIILFILVALIIYSLWSKVLQFKSLLNTKDGEILELKDNIAGLKEKINSTDTTAGNTKELYENVKKENKNYSTEVSILHNTLATKNNTFQYFIYRLIATNIQPITLLHELNTHPSTDKELIKYGLSAVEENAAARKEIDAIENSRGELND